MRGTATRYAAVLQPAIIKKVRADTVHLSPPSNGLSFLARTNTADAQFAGVLTNFYVDDDRITSRSGFRKIATMPGGKPIEHLIPYYGQPERLAAATNHTLCDAETGAVWASGFTSDDWSWTSFSNLGDQEYTVMCNGADGVWGWDGGTAAGGAAVAISRIEKVNPARCTVAAADIAQFHEGQTVIISGADATHAAANGPHRIVNVNATPNTFELAMVDLSGAPADQTTGAMAAGLQGSFEKLAVSPPDGNTWLQVDSLHIVLAHMNRLWFADESNLAVWYLPLQQKDGPLEVIPLNSIFKRGGTIKAIATWTVDGGTGLDDSIVIFTTNGESAIYSGVDPDTDLGLVGVYRSDPPMSKHSLINYGGELYVMLPTGVTPMTSMIKAGKEGLESVDRSVVQEFLQHSVAHREQTGWMLFLNPSSGRLFCNLPTGAGRYNQMIRHMPKAVWSKFEDIPAKCWGWIEPYVYFGDDEGNIYEMHPIHRNDDGRPIRVDVQMAWNQYKTPALKQFKMLLPYIVTDGNPKPYVDVKVDYDSTPVANQPEISESAETAASWDTATWDTSDWQAGTRNWANWTGVGALGRVGAVRLSAQVSNCTFAVTGFDVLFEEGSVFG
jgi:hypothetical protein